MEERECVRETELSEQARQVVAGCPRPEKIAEALTITPQALRDGGNHEEMPAGTRAAVPLEAIPPAEKAKIKPLEEIPATDPQTDHDATTLASQTPWRRTHGATRDVNRVEDHLSFLRPMEVDEAAGTPGKPANYFDRLQNKFHDEKPVFRGITDISPSHHT